MDGKGKDNQQNCSSSWHCDYSCCGEKNSPSTVLDGLQGGGVISLLGRERKLKMGSAKQQDELRTSGPPTDLCWRHLRRHLGPSLYGKGHPMHGAGYKARVGRREIRARGDKAKQLHVTH